jgi:predicted RNA binding protein YcfA (HicA-like mRNA interferase family)
MPKLPVVSTRQVVKILKEIGFEPAPKRGKGSHHAFVKFTANKTYLVIVPERDVIPKGTLLSILEQAGVTKDEFIGLVNRP